MLWDIIQQVQIMDQQENALSLERRVRKLEKELHAAKESLHNLTRILETKFGEGLSHIPDVDAQGPEDNSFPGKSVAKKTRSVRTRDELIKAKLRKARS